MSKKFNFAICMKWFNKNNFSITKLNAMNHSVVMCHIYIVDINNRGTSVVLIGTLTYR